MALPVIENCFRVTWNFATYEGVTPRVVQHYLWASADEGELGGNLWDNCVAGMFLPMHENFEPQSLDVLALDGVGATNVVGRPTGVPDLCNGGDNIVPAVAAVLSLRTEVRGPKARGRSYIGPVCEPNITNGVIVGDALNLPEIWSDFNGLLGEVDPAIGMCVASYTHEEAYPVRSFSLDPVAGTQRRRADQKRA